MMCAWPCPPPLCVANVSENQLLQLTCPPPMVVAAILGAAFGVSPACAPSGGIASGSAQRVNITLTLAAQCVGQPSCALLLSSALLGNPAPLVPKQGAASYACALPRSGAVSSNALSSSSGSNCTTLGLPVADPRGFLITSTSNGGLVTEFLVASFGQGVVRQQRWGGTQGSPWSSTVYTPGAASLPDHSVLALALPDPGRTLYVSTRGALYAAALVIMSDDTVVPGVRWLGGGAPLTQPPFAASPFLATSAGLQGSGLGFMEYRGLAATPLPVNQPFSPGSILTLQLHGHGFTPLSTNSSSTSSALAFTAAALLVEVHSDSGLRLQTLDLSYGATGAAVAAAAQGLGGGGFSVAAGDTRAGALSRTADGAAVLLGGLFAPPGTLFNATAPSAPSALVLSIAAGPSISVALALAPAGLNATALPAPLPLSAAGQGPTDRGDLVLCTGGGAQGSRLEVYAGGAFTSTALAPLGSNASVFPLPAGGTMAGCTTVSAAGASAALVSRGAPFNDVCLLRPALPSLQVCSSCTSATGNSSCEGSVALLQCPPGLVITQVTSAVWSTADPGGGCPSRLGFTPASPCSIDASAAVGMQCLGRGGCSVPMSTSILGDPNFPCGTPVTNLATGLLTPVRRYGISATCGLPIALPVCSTGNFFYSTMGSLSCPVGLVIGSVAQAVAGGSIAGICGAWTVAGCGPMRATFSFAANVSSQCLGRAACIFAANTNTYGDPCFSSVKRWVVTAYCVAPPATACASLGSSLVRDPRSAAALPAPSVASTATANSTTATSLVCATGAFGVAPIAVACPAGQVIVSVVGVAGMNAVGGSCGAWVPGVCTIGPGLGLSADFSALATSWCAGRSSCVVPYSQVVGDFCC